MSFSFLVFPLSLYFRIPFCEACICSLAVLKGLSDFHFNTLFLVVQSQVLSRECRDDLCFADSCFQNMIDLHFKWVESIIFYM